MKNKIGFIFIFSLVSVFQLFAEPVEKLVKVKISLNHTDWTYKLGEKVQFNITVTKNNQFLSNKKVLYEYGLEGLTPIKKDSAVVTNGQLTVEVNGLKTSGFLRCKAVVVIDGVKYDGYGTAGFEPENIKPTTDLPTDFTQFWDKAKADNAKIPLDTKMTLLPNRCTEKVNVYESSIQNYVLGGRVYGIVCIPKKPGKYPALLKVPGAGIRPYEGDIEMAEKGLITFEIGIHGISVTQEKDIYKDLSTGALSGYSMFNLDNKDKYYYKRVYLGCVRAVDFLYSLPEFDGKNIAVTGGSQGGALTIVTASLDSRIKYLAAFYPALCDLTGYLHGRVGGWPHMFCDAWSKFNCTKEKIETSKYYDVVNFARFVKVPGFYSWGFNDFVCPPTSTYSAYNEISAPKSLLIFQETGHWTYPEQMELSKKWLIDQLIVK